MAELSTLARPYAKAAFEYAAAEGQLEKWLEALALSAAVAQQSKVVALLQSPNYMAAVQADKLIEICGDKLDEKQQNFLRLLAENRRLVLLPEIHEQFQILKANREKAVTVELIAASEISAEQQDKLTKALSTRLEREISMQVTIDKSLLGGAVIRAGDTVIDGSIRGRLTKLAEALNS